MVHFADHIGTETSFYDVHHKQIISFLDTKIKSEQIDIDKKWITTWNDYLGRIKFFFCWLYNYKIKNDDEEDSKIVEDMKEWETPEFVRIRKKKTKRESPYSETNMGTGGISHSYQI
jgi:integrase/recombinase XerD